MRVWRALVYVAVLALHAHAAPLVGQGLSALIEVPDPVAMDREHLYTAGQEIPQSDCTLTVQSSLERLEQGRIEALAKTWQGPISYAILARNTDEAAKVREYFAQPGLDKDVGKYVSATLFTAKDTFEFYPINLMRNHALHGASTDWVFVMDMDEGIMGSMEDYMTEVKRAEAKQLAPSQPIYSLLSYQTTEKGANSGLHPKNNLDIAKGFDEGTIMVKKGYGPRGVQGENTKGGWPSMDDATEVPYRDWYEPYYIARRSDTIDFDPRFIGWGANKCVHSLELALKGAHFILLPHVFTFVDENPAVEKPTKSVDWAFVEQAYKELGKRYGCDSCTTQQCEQCLKGK